MAKVNIAFCFDENLVKPICVTIASLLDHKKVSTHYQIYCICTKKAALVEPELRKIVWKRDTSSKLFFIPVTNPYIDGFEIRNITKACYLRLLIPRLLPTLNKIVYSDVDVLFTGDLSDVYGIDIKKYCLAAVKGLYINLSNIWEQHIKNYDYWKNSLDGVKGKYFNSGFLLMNLKYIRRNLIDDQWHNMVSQSFFYVDQDILNITCKDKVYLLPRKYNSAVDKIPKELLEKAISERLFTRQEIRDSIKNVAVLHYNNPVKPWEDSTIPNANFWIDYVKSQPDLKVIFNDFLSKEEKRIDLERNKYVESILQENQTFKGKMVELDRRSHELENTLNDIYSSIFFRLWKAMNKLKKKIKCINIKLK